MRRLLPLVLAATLVVALAPAVSAGASSERTFKPVRRVKVTRDLVYPIVGRTRTINGFGSCRDNCTREHHGNDLLTYGWKGAPVVAAHDGVITEIRDDREWCNVEVTGDDGWYTRYVHMNNDSPGYDDRRYRCTPPGLQVGSRVKAGQLIGWVGDSGNAEHTQPHIHFELRMPSGLPVDPYRTLKAAKHIELRVAGTQDPAATAAQIGIHAYPEGAPTVTLVALDEYRAMLAGGFAPLQLNGPLLLSEWDTMPQATLDAINALQPFRVEVVGDLWLQDVLDQVGGRSAITGRSLMERVVAEEMGPGTAVVAATTTLDEQQETFADGIGSVVAAPAPVPVATEPAFSIVFLGDLEELSADDLAALSALSERVSTTVMDFAEPAGTIGLPAFAGIGSSGSRYTLYFPTGDGWQRIAAKRAPEEAPDYGVFIVDPSSLDAPTLAFLDSLIDAPVMPFWR